MTEPQDLDVLQHGATATRRGFHFPIFGVEVVSFTRHEDSRETVLCTTGWHGIAVRLSGKAILRRWAAGEIVEGPAPGLRVYRSQDFTSYSLQTRRARFLMLRIGRKVNRSKMVEMVGDQVSAQVIEEVVQDTELDYPQVVVSDDAEGEGGGIDATTAPQHQG